MDRHLPADTAPAAVATPDNEPEIIVGSREQLLYLLAEAAEIEHTAHRARRDERRQPVEIGAARMVGALDIGLRVRAELCGDEAFVGLGHRHPSPRRQRRSLALAISDL